MTQTRKLSLIAAATLLAALSLPRSSRAQVPENVFGKWTGVASYQTSIYGNDGLIDTYSGSGAATLSISSINVAEGYFAMAVGGDFPYPIAYSGISVSGVLAPPGETFPIVPPGFNYTDVFGPTSASGSVVSSGGPPGLSSGNFFLTYQSFGDGFIDVGNGTALADLTSISYDPLIPGGEIVSFATFQTANVPEPSSIVHAVLAVLVIAVVASLRGFRPKPWARQL